jgi:acylphosphatase
MLWTNTQCFRPLKKESRRMNRCMRITCAVEGNEIGLHTFVQKYAKIFALEGMVQPISDTRVRVVVCGAQDTIEDVVDALHHGVVEQMLSAIEIEPFLKDRDYRGVFRVIE